MYTNNALGEAAPTAFFIYLSLMFVVAVGSVVFQWQRRKGNEEKFSYEHLDSEADQQHTGRWSTSL